MERGLISMNINDSDNKTDDPSNSGFESLLRESIGNMGWDIEKGRVELILGHYPDLDRKELCVCMGFCSAIWDSHFNTSYDVVIEYSINEGKRSNIGVNQKPLFTKEQEVKEVIERLKANGIMRSSIGYTVNGFRGKCRSKICPKVFYHLVSYMNMKPEIEHDAWLIVSRSFEGAVQSAFGPIKPEE